MAAPLQPPLVPARPVDSPRHRYADEINELMPEIRAMHWKHYCAWIGGDDTRLIGMHWLGQCEADLRGALQLYNAAHAPAERLEQVIQTVRQVLAKNSF
jgi:hypothetical protein